MTPSAVSKKTAFFYQASHPAEQCGAEVDLNPETAHPGKGAIEKAARHRQSQQHHHKKREKCKAHAGDGFAPDFCFDQGESDRGDKEQDGQGYQRKRTEDEPVPQTREAEDQTNDTRA